MLSLSTSTDAVLSLSVWMYCFYICSVKPVYFYVSEWLYYFYVGRGSAVVRTSGSQSREPEFESSCFRFEALAISFVPRCHSSLSCTNEYLATDRDGYRNDGVVMKRSARG